MFHWKSTTQFKFAWFFLDPHYKNVFTPDSSVSSLILIGWCEEGHPATRTRFNIPRDRQPIYGD